jgi:hypothetical protein
MATGTIQLPIGAIPADGSASNSFPAPSFLTSTDADNPKARRPIAAFDDTTNETLNWGFRLPSNYASGGTLKGNFYAVPVTGDVVWRAALRAVTPADAVDIKAIDPVNDSGCAWATVTVAAPGTTGYITAFTITMTMNSAAAGDSIVIEFQRNAADAADTAVGDAIVLDEIHLEYTTS